MTTPTHAVLDLDMYKYQAAHVGEKKSIVVTHKTEGWSEPYKTRTDFWGHYKKKAGGALADKNNKRDSPYLPDEFDIEDIQTPEPIANVLHTVKSMVDGDLFESDAKSYEGYIGTGDSFRVELSTLLKYKGNRDVENAPPKPLALDAVTEYLFKKYKAEEVTGIECDDKCVISAYKDPTKFVIIEDKDYWNSAINVYDVNQRHRGIVNCDKLGYLFLDDKKKVRGEGRIHMYYQILSEDTVDNYKANCFSDVPWASKGAYNALKDCKTDKECFQVMVDCFKVLYPDEYKTVKGWRGNDIAIDWYYVMQEMFWMAHMKRTETESLIILSDVLDKLGVQY